MNNLSPGQEFTASSGLRFRNSAFLAAVFLCFWLVIFAVSGCVGTRQKEDLGPLAINSFAAAPAAVTIGQSTTLVWSVSGAVKLALSDGNSSVGGAGVIAISANSVQVTPANSDTYTLTASDAYGHTTTATATVTVVPPPAIASFTAFPAIVAEGKSTTLSWNVSDAATVSIDNGVGIVTGNSVTVQPSSSTTYTLTVTSASGAMVSAQTTVQVVATPVVASFSAAPAIIGIGQTSTLSWSVIGATGISINNGVGPVTGTSVTVTPSKTTTYTLTATNTLGSVSVSATAQTKITVSSTPPPVISAFNASAASVGPGGIITLTAVFTPTDGTATATINHGVGTVTSGVPVDTLPISSSTTFTLTVTNDVGTAQATMRVAAGNVAVFAGEPTHPGYQDGRGTTARFSLPGSISSDTSGNFYVADTDNEVIRMITSTGLVSTLAGNPGVTGSLDGTGSAAEFDSPYGVAVDSNGNVFVADTSNSTIREIMPGGVVTTFAGTASNPGFQDGTGLAASFGLPQGLAIDSFNNLYVADVANCNIRKITPQAVVTTIAGPVVPGECGDVDGDASAARFQNPSGVAVDGQGNVYVADTNNQTIRQITTAGTVITFAGTPGVAGSTDGTGTAASFRFPTSVATDNNGYLYVTDTQNYTVRRISPSAQVMTLVGMAGQPDPYVSGGPLPSRIAAPRYLVADPLSGDLFYTMSVDAIANSPY